MGYGDELTSARFCSILNASRMSELPFESPEHPLRGETVVPTKR
jgi:hypothetical protein